MGAVVHLTGLSPDVLRAWERRHSAIEPPRSPGGSRRYRESDVQRLRLLAAATRAGHGIGSVARLDDAELARLVDQAEAAAPATSSFTEVLEALGELDPVRAEDLASRQLSALGPIRFARDFALPLAQAIGERWVEGHFCVASEHLGTALLRSLLGASLRPSAIAQRGPKIVFATPPGERHELGLLSAALVVVGAGCNPIYLGPELPLEEILRAVEIARAHALAVSLTTLRPDDARRALRALRGGLPDEVALWVGGAAAADLELPDGAEHVATLDALEQKALLLARVKSSI
jgi:DNA-binding transcriptional MerR regulator